MQNEMADFTVPDLARVLPEVRERNGAADGEERVGCRQTVLGLLDVRALRLRDPVQRTLRQFILNSFRLVRPAG